MPKFRKKPIEVEAFQFTRESIIFDGPGEKLPDWVQHNSKIGMPEDKDSKSESLLIINKTGEVIALQGDYLIKNDNGDITVMPARVFHQIWDLIEDETDENAG